MPRGDGTGPWGQGSMTGRGLGYCSGYERPGFMTPGPGMGFGRGMGITMGPKISRTLRVFYFFHMHSLISHYLKTCSVGWSD